MERVYFDAGHTLFRAGEEADCMFIVVSGRVRTFILAEKENNEKNYKLESYIKNVSEVRLFVTITNHLL
jgi:CRP-like cAMP-binding protein